MTSRDTRIEQAIASGRTDEWMLRHVPCTRADIAHVRAYLAEVWAEDPPFEVPPLAIAIRQQRRRQLLAALEAERLVVALNRANYRHAARLAARDALAAIRPVSPDHRLAAKRASKAAWSRNYRAARKGAA